MQKDTNFDYVGHFIHSFRASRGESLQVMAQRSGVSRSMIAQIEAGKTSPTLAVLSKLAIAMQVSLGDLVQPPEGVFNISTSKASDDNIVSKKRSVFVCHLLTTQHKRFSSEVYQFYFNAKGRTSFAANIAGATKHLWLEQGELLVQKYCSSSANAN